MWEYKTIEFSPSGTFGGKVPTDWLTNVLNMNGNEGWELVTMFAVAGEEGETRTVVGVFKRIKEENR